MYLSRLISSLFLNTCVTCIVLVYFTLLIAECHPGNLFRTSVKEQLWKSSRISGNNVSVLSYNNNDNVVADYFGHRVNKHAGEFPVSFKVFRRQKRDLCIKFVHFYANSFVKAIRNLIETTNISPYILNKIWSEADRVSRHYYTIMELEHELANSVPPSKRILGTRKLMDDVFKTSSCGNEYLQQFMNMLPEDDKPVGENIIKKMQAILSKASLHDSKLHNLIFNYVPRHEFASVIHVVKKLTRDLSNKTKYLKYIRKNPSRNTYLR